MRCPKPRAAFVPTAASFHKTTAPADDPPPDNRIEDRATAAQGIKYINKFDRMI